MAENSTSLPLSEFERVRFEKAIQEERDRTWITFITTAAGCTEIEPPKNPEDFLRFIKEVFEVRETGHQFVTARLREQIQFEQDTKTLIQKGSTAELVEHREYKEKIHVLLRDLLVEIELVSDFEKGKSKDEPIHLLGLLGMKQRISELIK